MVSTWSISRDQILHTCERRYYFHYLAPARINSRNKTLREIAFLKKLKNVPMWKGDIFHSLVAEYLHRVYQKTQLLPIDLFDTYEQKMQDQWKSSMNSELQPNSKVFGQGNELMLFEHFYKGNLSENSLSDAIRGVKNWVSRFSVWVEDVAFHKEILQASQTWIEPQIYGTEAPSFELDGIQIIAKVDLAFLTQEGQFNIFDWKTSIHSTQPARQFNQAEFQAAVYQLWPHLKFGKSLDTIRAHLVYLGGEMVEQRTFKIDENMRVYTLSLIRRSISRMQHFSKVHDGVQLTLNHNTYLTLDDLDFAAYEKACSYCPFKILCQRRLEI